MPSPEYAFWLAAGLTAYTYLGYPLLIGLLAWWRGRPVRRNKACCPAVSIVLPVFNEETRILERLDELHELLAASGLEGEILVVLDGSTDRTAELAHGYEYGNVRILDRPQRLGKALAITANWAVAQHDILVFADARQTWEPEALLRLLENFADPEVGAVSGDLVLTNKPGVLRGVGAYWTFEKWLRRQESQVYATVGVTGAISAVRRELFQPIPPGVLLDDVYWPLHVVLQGYRVIHDERARAFDRLPDKAQDEFRRKVRTLAGNFQLLTRLPAALLPGVNPVWIQFVSHKLLRLVVPWALLTMLVLSALLPGMFYLAAFWLQVAFYTLGLGGMVAEPKPRGRLVAAASSFLVLNAAAFAAFWVWACGRASQSWTKVAYQPTPANIAWRFPVPREPEHADSAS